MLRSLYKKRINPLSIIKVQSKINTNIINKPFATFDRCEENVKESKTKKLINIMKKTHSNYRNYFDDNFDRTGRVFIYSSVIGLTIGIDQTIKYGHPEFMLFGLPLGTLAGFGIIFPIHCLIISTILMVPFMIEKKKRK